MSFNVFPRLKCIPAGIGLGLLAFLLVGPGSLLTAQEKAKEKEQEKPVRITEEIQVVGQKPKDQPVATVTRLDFTLIDRNKARDLSEALRYAPGVNITVGNKYEFSLKLRGMSSGRIALLIDGVPSYEPYFGTFDLKTVSAAGLDSIQITKGPSSVLYGPNTLGGIVNVITRRPGESPGLTLNGSYGAKNTRTVGLDGGGQWGRFAVAGDFAYQGSDGFAYPNPATGEETNWANTGYHRLNMNGKLYYAPSSGTEIMVDGGFFSDYGMPAAVSVQKPRYWHFKNWDRSNLSAGGFTSLGENSTLRFRAFTVNYQNTLDMYADKAMTKRQSESSYDNTVSGIFALADLGLTDWNSLKVSLDYQGDTARIQDDVNLPWTKNRQGTYSVAAEDEITLSRQWRLIGGLSVDTIDKFRGGSASRVNPLIGVKFTPWNSLDLHLSFSEKSRFPNMRALYSPSGGNPDLLSETGTNAELGFTWNAGFYVSGSIFTYQFKNFIDTVLLPTGIRQYFNVGRAHINGFEVQAKKSLGWIDGTINYTWLDRRNETSARPLDALSPHTLNFDVTLRPAPAIHIDFFGLFASASSWFDSTSGKVLDIPSYFNLDAIAAWDFGRFELFLKATNLFNDYIYSEPVFPWRARFFELGARARIF